MENLKSSTDTAHDKFELAKKHFDEMEEKYKKETDKSVKRTSYYPDMLDTSKINRSKKETTNIIVANADMLEAAIDYQDGKTCILNAGSFIYAGGAYLAGGDKGQEVQLCSSGNLCNILTKLGFYYKMNSKKANGKLLSDNLLYTPSVLFECPKKNDDNQTEKYFFDVITCSEPVLSGVLHPGIVLSTIDIRMDHILYAAYENNVDTIILNAFGSWCFEDASDMSLIAGVIKHLLTSKYKYEKQFKNIVFALKGAKQGGLEGFNSVFTENTQENEEKPDVITQTQKDVQNSSFLHNYLVDSTTAKIYLVERDYEEYSSFGDGWYRCMLLNCNGSHRVVYYQNVNNTNQAMIDIINKTRHDFKLDKLE